MGCGLVRHSAVPQAAERSAQPADTSSESEETGPVPGEEETDSTADHDPPPSSDISEFSSEREVRDLLMDAYNEWEGTPYLLGGSQKTGIDCSQLVSVIFEEYFDTDLPPTTRSQLNTGVNIRRKAIRTGDLIFFRTGKSTLHVGIAVNQGEFLHASTSKGVMISKLGNSYWRERYLTARRVL